MRNYTRRFLSRFFDRSDETFPEEPLLQAETRLDPVDAELNKSWWSSLTFSWVTPIMETGSKRQLGYGDLFALPKDMTAEVCCSQLFRNWEKEKTLEGPEQPSLFRALYATYGWPWLIVGVVKIINDSLSFSGPLFLNEIVKFLETGNEDLLYGYVCAVGLGIVSIIRAFLGAHYTFLICRLRMQVKASITTMVYQKALCVSLSERSIFSTGEIQTFMSVDAERISNLVNCGHEIWSLPLQMGIALWMLYMQVKFAFLAGLGVIILLIPVNKWIASFMCSANESMMKEKDERVRRIGELLMYIRTLKMYTWEQFFLERVMQSREQELKFLGIKKYLDACCVYFWACTPTIFSLLTFGLFVMLGYTLTAATVFTSLALFNILIAPLNSFPWVINGLVEGQVSLGRLCKFFSCPEMNQEWTKEILLLSECEKEPTLNSATVNYSDNGETLQESESSDDMAIMLENAAFSWSHSLVENYVSIISQLSLAIPTGCLVVILGKVGSGKSSLLEAILGEMRCTYGSMLVNGRLAYVPQVPWIQAGTLSGNILFGKAYIADRYKSVVDACALDVDIQQMQGGDLAEIGERGVNLSGGQRTRVALARALYQDCETYLLDDPLSAVDAHVAAWLMEHAIAGPQMVNKTRILCTHHAQAIAYADIVVKMEDGRVTYLGSAGSDPSLDIENNAPAQESFPLEIPGPPKGLPCSVDTTTMSPLLQYFEEQSSRGVSQFMSPSKRMCSSGISSQRKSSSTTSTSTASNSQNMRALKPGPTKPVKLIEDEDRIQGHVQGTVYRAYGSFVNWSVIATILVSVSLMQATRNGSDLWLAHWVDTDSHADGQQTLNFYLKIYIALAVANSIITLARAFSFAYGGMRAASRVHTAFIQKVITAPVRFFDQNPSGRILNRFNSDQYIVDDSLPFVLNNLLAQLFSLIGITVVLCVVQWLFIVVLIPLVLMYDRLQKYYRATSRELRRLDGVSRSPIYTSFTEALEGAATIRAFRAQAQFAAKNRENVGINLRSSYSELCASLWLSIRLQILAALLVFFISFLAIFSRQSHSRLSPLSAGLVGLGLSYASPIITTLNNVLAHLTETEKDMVSMERIQQYMDLEAEPCDGCVEVPSDWPAHGNIAFSQVTLVYMPSLRPALHELSFDIQAGEQVGIAGRTGAGKSSILSVLFRLTPISSGKIFIDGVDISKVPLRVLRSRLSVVPQSPMLFEGTLRQNLNPAGNIDDVELWTMLKKCHMKEAVIGAGGLDLHVSECGESLSLGQRQLLCLARALLSCVQVLCLDECTANIDPETTTLLMKTVASECRDMTVITIAHRITTILEQDRVLILDHGSLIEEGEPKTLLEDPNSKFSGLVKVSGGIGRPQKLMPPLKCMLRKGKLLEIMMSVPHQEIELEVFTN
ncbi:unnamed protein product [Calypogeia fissa]